jgi:hypothetical protein
MCLWKFFIMPLLYPPVQEADKMTSDKKLLLVAIILKMYL